MVLKSPLTCKNDVLAAAVPTFENELHVTTCFPLKVASTALSGRLAWLLGSAEEGLDDTTAAALPEACTCQKGCQEDGITSVHQPLQERYWGCYEFVTPLSRGIGVL